MPHTINPEFSSIIHAQTARRITIEENSPLDDLLEMYNNDGFEFGLHEINSCLTTLLTKFTADELWEQIDPLFKTSGSLDKILTELLGLTFFYDNADLISIGWPNNSKGNPPFEGMMQLYGHPTVFDIKSASGSGYDWLPSKLRPIIQKWCLKNSLGPVDIEFEHIGQISAQALSPHLRAIIQSLSTSLSPLTAIPADPVEIPTPITSIKVCISPKSGFTVSGGTVDVEIHAKTIAETIKSHVLHKGEMAHNGDLPPYIIAYVRPQGRGDSDIKPYSFELAMKFVNAELTAFPGYDRWLGTLLIDRTSHHDRTIAKFYNSPNMNRPPSLTQENISASFNKS